uniref:Cytochrome P450 n=1 Tax=Kalanchoe fedtschenkoi TaxID=63787 RepID=A0A7N0U2R2_KALFE
MEAAIAALVVVYLIWFWILNRHKPHLTNWPILGMLPSFLINVTRVHDFITYLLQTNGHTITIEGPWFSNFSLVFTSDPENVHYILSKNFANFNKGHDFKEIFENLGEGILVADGDSWKMQRKLSHSLFKNSNFLSLVEKCAEQKVQDGLFKILDHASESGLEVDMQDLFQRFTFDVACIFMLGVDLNSLALGLPEVPFTRAIDDLEETLLHRHFKPERLWKLQKWLRVGMEKKALKAAKTFNDFIYHQIALKRELINNRKSSRNEEGDEKDEFDMISILMKEEAVMEKCNNGNNSTKAHDKFLRDSVMNILSAGRDTSSTALTWFFWVVATYPQVRSKLIQEIEAFFQMKPGDPWTFPSVSELNKLVYLHATFCETLRLYTPVPFNHKASVKADTLPSGHRVKQETKIMISMYTMGRMEEIWGKDALVFRPERWISEKGSIIDMPSYKFNTFGAGPRLCVGKDLAFMEMKTVAAAIIWSYDLKIVTGHSVSLASSIILHMKNGLKVNVTKK